MEEPSFRWMAIGRLEVSNRIWRWMVQRAVCAWHAHTGPLGSVGGYPIGERLAGGFGGETAITDA